MKKILFVGEGTTSISVLYPSITYTCSNACRHDVHLLVKGATGGLWKFPLRFIATEPEPDDDIVIKATGLGQESSVGFRLNSQTRYNTYTLRLSFEVIMDSVKSMR